MMDEDCVMADAEVHCKNIRIYADILWRVFHILTELVPYTFVSVNGRNNETRAHIVKIFVDRHNSLRNYIFPYEGMVPCVVFGQMNPSLSRLPSP